MDDWKYIFIEQPENTTLFARDLDSSDDPAYRDYKVFPPDDGSDPDSGLTKKRDVEWETPPHSISQGCKLSSRICFPFSLRSLPRTRESSTCSGQVHSPTSHISPFFHFSSPKTQAYIWLIILLMSLAEHNFGYGSIQVRQQPYRIPQPFMICTLS